MLGISLSLNFFVRAKHIPHGLTLLVLHHDRLRNAAIHVVVFVLRRTLFSVVGPDF